ncbi:MAG TPA: zf-HC2 domain-containing protein [Opitutaceae bacterium]|nr:zf-HC2 domain-containing protein [Opitutaceae bacterium]
MECNETRRWLVAHLDGELDLVHDAGISTHLQTCAACAAAARQQSALRDLVREKLLPFVPPPHLATRIRAQLRAEKESARPRLSWWPSWNMAGVLAALCIATLAGYEWGGRRAESADFGAEMVSSHLRAVMSDHMLDVVSSDRHTVKPWLSGKLDFSPPVADLAADGFPLLGARVERLEGQTVAALVYQRHKHFVTVFIWPAATELPFTQASHLGYGMRAWRQADMNFVAVSDVADSDLDEFVGRLRASIQ